MTADPMPKFPIPNYPYPKLPQLKFADLAPHMQTGDIVLVHGTSTLSDEIQDITLSPYSHSTMVVVLETDGKKTAPLLWESTIDEFPDVMAAGERHEGVQLNDMATFMREYHGKDSHFTYRRLNWDRTEKGTEAFHDFLLKQDKVPFPTIAGMAGHFFEGQIEIACGDTTFFCAQLVAKSLKTMGAMGDKHVDNWYSPKKFGGDSDKLDLVEGASFGEPIQVIP